jgi:hypothetical protein
MRVRYTPEAFADRERIIEYLRERSPGGPAKSQRAFAMLSRSWAAIHLADIEPTTRKYECSSSSATLTKSFIGYARQSKSCTFATRRDGRTAERGCHKWGDWSGRRESNPRMQLWETEYALTISMMPHYQCVDRFRFYSPGGRNASRQMLDVIPPLHVGKVLAQDACHAQVVAIR